MTVFSRHRAGRITVTVLGADGILAAAALGWGDLRQMLLLPILWTASCLGGFLTVVAAVNSWYVMYFECWYYAPRNPAGRPC
jgi:hypothetical protein